MKEMEKPKATAKRKVDATEGNVPMNRVDDFRYGT